MRGSDMYSFFMKTGIRKPAAWMFVTAAVWLAGVIYLYHAAADEVHVVINEACSSNFSVIQDENGNYADYVELYNPAAEPVSLTDMYLSDDNGEPQKHALDGIVVPAGEYVLIWLDKSGGAQTHITHPLGFRTKERRFIFLTPPEGCWIL